MIMNSAYVYLQIYKLFDSCTPIKADCGQLCDKACCKGDNDCGMYLFPGEKEVYKLLSPDWVKIEQSDFTYMADCFLSSADGSPAWKFTPARKSAEVL